MSATWTDDELRHVGAATELQIATRRDDGSLRPYVTIWTVRAGDHLYVRSAYGADNPWFRRATASASGRIRAGGIERDDHGSTNTERGPPAVVPGDVRLSDVCQRRLNLEEPESRREGAIVRERDAVF